MYNLEKCNPMRRQLLNVTLENFLIFFHFCLDFMRERVYTMSVTTKEGDIGCKSVRPLELVAQPTYHTMLTTSESFASALYEGAVTNPYGEFHEIAEKGEMRWCEYQLTDEAIRLVCNYIGELVTVTPQERLVLEDDGHLASLANRVLNRASSELVAKLIMRVLFDLTRVVEKHGLFDVIRHYAEREMSSDAPKYSNVTFMRAMINVIRIEQSKIEIRVGAVSKIASAVFGMVKRGKMNNIPRRLFNGGGHYIMNLVYHLHIVVEEIKVALYDASYKQLCGNEMTCFIRDAFEVSFYNDFYFNARMLNGIIVRGTDLDDTEIKEKFLPNIQYVIEIIKSII